MDTEVARRLRLTLELCEFGVAMQRQKLRREHPDLDETQMGDLFAAWMLNRIDAPDGDCAGQVSRRP